MFLYKTINVAGDSEPEESEERRKRRRKRRSRWAPEDTKVDVPAIMSVDPNIGVAIPAALGTVVSVKPPTQTPKLPGTIQTISTSIDLILDLS